MPNINACRYDMVHSMLVIKDKLLLVMLQSPHCFTWTNNHGEETNLQFIIIECVQLVTITTFAYPNYKRKFLRSWPDNKTFQHFLFILTVDTQSQFPRLRIQQANFLISKEIVKAISKHTKIIHEHITSWIRSSTWNRGSACDCNFRSSFYTVCWYIFRISLRTIFFQ